MDNHPTPSPQLAADTHTTTSANAMADTHNHHHRSCSNLPTAPDTVRTDQGQDPLAVLEHNLLAHPSTHHFLHHHHHQHHHSPSPNDSHHHYGQTLAPPPTTASPNSPSPVSSRSPSPGARRCMAAMASWTPRPDAGGSRRQSWDGQAYRRAMMVQATGLACDCHPGEEAKHRQEHHQGSLPQDSPLASDHHTIHHVPAQSSYDLDRGFSEAIGGVH